MDISRRQIGLLAGGAFAALAARPVAAVARSAVTAPVPPIIDPTPFVHPELRSLVPVFLKYQSAGTLSDASLPMMRKMLAGASADPAARLVQIAGKSGAPDVPIYLLNENAAERGRPAILHIHGGGFIAGRAASETGKLIKLAKALDCLIVTVDYRLAPETSFPGPLDDCLAALQWLHANAGTLGVDRGRIALMGGSAGGGLAAMLAIAARDAGNLPVCFQMLIYPMLDDRTGSTHQIPAPMGSLTWTAEANRYGWSSFLGVKAGSSRVPKGAVPARVESVKALPPTFIGVGSIDLFLEEDVAYANRLMAAGIPTELVVVPGAFHGFEGAAPTAGISRRFEASIQNALADAFRLKW